MTFNLGKDSLADLSEQDEPFIGYEPSQNDSFSDRFNAIGKKNQEVESTFDWGIRNAEQLGARAYETIAGMPGNFKKAYQTSRDFLESMLPEDENLQGLSKREQDAFGEPSKGSIYDDLMHPPTSQDIRQRVTPVIAEAMGKDRDFLEPKGEGETAAGEFAQDLTSFFLPGTGQLRMLTRIGAPIIGNLTKQGLKYLDIDEKIADQAKTGMMLATTIAGQSNPAQFSRDRIAQATQMIPENATVAALPLADRLMNLYNRSQRGLGVPSKSRAVQGMQDLAGQVQNGRIPLRNLMDARNDVNEWIAEAGGWDIPAATRDRTIANLNEFKTQLIRTIDENLNTRFPEAGELYRTGYEAAAVTHQSNAISNFIERNFGRKAKSVGAKVLFPGLVGGASVLPKTAGAAAITFPLYKTGQILYRVGNSPTLARYYSQVLAESAAGNIGAMNIALDKLDKELYKQEQKEAKNPKRKSSLEDFKSSFQR